MEKRSLSRRDFMRLSSLAAAGAVLAACGPAPTPETIEVEKVVTQEVEIEVEKVVTQQVEVEVEKVVTPTPVAQPEATTVRFLEMGGRWQSWVEMLALPTFYEMYPWITVEYEPIDWSTFPDKQLTQMAAGTAPDVLHGWSEVFQKWVSKGQTLNLDPYVESDFPEEDLNDQIPFQWETLVYPWTGERYAIPGYVDMGLLYYNKDAYDEKGLPYPTKDWTYDDYAATCAALIDYDASGEQTTWGGWFWYWSWTFMSYHVNAFGGKVRDDETWMTCLLSEPEAKEAIEWIRARIWDDSSWINNTQIAAVGITGDSAELFATEVFSMMEADIEFWPSLANTIKFNWDVMHVPIGPAGRFNLGDNDAWCIYKGSAERGSADASWKFIRFLNSPFFQRLMVHQDGVVPARWSINQEWPGILRQQFPALSPVSLEVVTDAFEMGYLIPSEQFRFQADAQPPVQSALERIWQVGDVGVEILDEVCAEVNRAQQDALAKEEL